MKKALTVFVAILLFASLVKAQSYCDSCYNTQICDTCYNGACDVAPDSLCSNFVISHPTNPAIFNSVPFLGGCDVCFSQNRPTTCYNFAIKNISTDCFLCKVEIFSCDTFLVCSTIIQDTGASPSDTGSCRYVWGSPPLTRRGRLIPGEPDSTHILNCKHNQTDCNTYPLTLVPFPALATTNDPNCMPNGLCGVGPGKQLDFRICLIEKRRFKRLTIRLYYSCPIGTGMKTCKRVVMWESQNDINNF